MIRKNKTIGILIMLLLFSGLVIGGVLSTKELAFTTRDTYVILEKDRLVTEADYFDITDKTCQINSLSYNSSEIFCYIDYNYSINDLMFSDRIFLGNDTSEDDDWERVWTRLRNDLASEDKLGEVEEFIYTERVWNGRIINKGVLV